MLPWLLVTIAVAAWSVDTEPIREVEDGLGLRSVALLLAPLRILRLGSESDRVLVQPVGLEGLAYALLGVQFIFVVLALRQFFGPPLAGKPGARQESR